MNLRFIPNSDISTYKDFNEISSAVSDAEEKVKQKELERQVIKLYNNDEWSVIIPLSYEASKTYGANTKWCTTQEKYWNEYITSYKLIYIQNKKTNEKYAVSRHWEQKNKLQAWLSNDDETSPMLLPLPIEVMEIIIREVNNNETILGLQDKHNIKGGIVSVREYSVQQIVSNLSSNTLRGYDYGSYDVDSYNNIRRMLGGL